MSGQSKMKLPNFTAEASLYRSHPNYYVVSRVDTNAVMPSLHQFVSLRCDDACIRECKASCMAGESGLKTFECIHMCYYNCCPGMAPEM
jgi:hypothetical protein